MVELNPAFAEFTRCIRPLLLDTWSDDAPIGFFGSCTLVRLGAICFVVATGHQVARNHSGQLRVQPFGCEQRLRLSQGIASTHDGHGADLDLTVFPVSLDGLDRRSLKRCRFVNMLQGIDVGWLDAAPVSSFFVVGFPSQLLDVYYDESRIRAAQVAMPAVYVGPCHGLLHKHVLAVTDGFGLTTFDGFSGGAVFSFHRLPGAAASCRFCGIVTEGTPGSGLVHFVDVRYVHQLLSIADAHVQACGLLLPSRLKKFDL